MGKRQDMAWVGLGAHGGRYKIQGERGWDVCERLGGEVLSQVGVVSLRGDGGV